ncbi:MAG: phosphodiester glycosidase family protein [Rikenellaceae bacterium]|nr:phosphodiester glycosidase family protein [Rikenellaceae bacterium]
MKYLILTAALLGIASSRAQSPADSARFCDPANWEVIRNENGILVKEYQSRRKQENTFLFSAPQALYVMEVNPALCRIAPVQDEKKQTVSRAVRSREALAGVNGGFFAVKPEPRDAAVANDYLKIGGQVISPAPTPGWGNAAVGFDSCRIPHFAHWDKSMENDLGWSAAYPDVLVAGPMILLGGQSLHGWPDIDKNALTEADKHSLYAPRTAIGIRPDSTVVLVVIDGRRGRAFGASFTEMAVIGRWLGLTDMMNLDGGGSSAMVAGRLLVNFPSDGCGILPLERNVANVLLVFPR